MCVQLAREGCAVHCQQHSWILLTCTFLASNIHLCLKGKAMLQQFFLENKPRNSCHFRCCSNYLAFQNSFLCYYTLYKTLCFSCYYTGKLLCYYLLHKTFCSVQDLIKTARLHIGSTCACSGQTG